MFLTMLLPARFHQNCQAAFGRCKQEWVKGTLGVYVCVLQAPSASLAYRAVTYFDHLCFRHETRNSEKTYTPFRNL